MILILPIDPTQVDVLSESQEGSVDPLGDLSILPTGSPSSPSLPKSRRVVNQQMTPRLLAFFLAHSGGTLSGLSAELGVTKQSLRQYLIGKRSKPSLEWFLRFITALGGTLEVTTKKGEKVQLIYTPMPGFEK